MEAISSSGEINCVDRCSDENLSNWPKNQVAGFLDRLNDSVVMFGLLFVPLNFKMLLHH